jgi:hypothetical protein
MVVLHKEKEVRVDPLIDSALKEEIWNVYEDSFQELNTNHPCRQSLTRSEFDNFMADEDIHKFLVFREGEFVGGSFVTENLCKIPWISAAFYDTKYPEYIGLRMYAQSFFIKPSNRARGNLQALSQELAKFMRAKALKICFCDWGGRNDILFALILRAANAHALGTIDVQVYDGIVLND